MFKIEDLYFDIESAILDAFIDEDDMTINWGVEIKAKSGEGKYSRWSPLARSETFLKNKPTQIGHWLDLAGTQVVWNEPYDSEDEPYAMFYVFEHEPIYESNILISRKGKTLYIKWAGKSDVNWDSKYGKDLKFDIETEIVFKGILFGRESEVNSKSLLLTFFDPNLFEFVQDKHGVSIFRPK